MRAPAESAHAWASGMIEFRPANTACPKGALPLPDVPRQLIEAKARHSYDGSCLLVPGVPEAQNPSDAMTALQLFCGRLEGVA